MQTMTQPVATAQLAGTTNSAETALQSAQYIADMLLELRNLAKASGQKSLQALLELSYYEAYTVANPVKVPADEMQRLEDMARDAIRAETL